jgi:hypothetical protein
VSWRELVPEPLGLWIRAVPKRWPAPESPALDLAERRILWPAEEPGPAELPPAPSADRADPCYVPPVPRALRSRRERWVLDLERTGGVAIVHLTWDEAGEPAATGSRWVDAFAFLLGAASSADAASLPLEVPVAFPLLPGLSATPESWRPWLEAFAVAGRRLVAGLPVELTPLDRRRLADRAGEQHWEAIFHGDAADERQFVRLAAELGLETRVPRPRAPRTPRSQRNRDLATALAEAGHLVLRLGGSEAEGQALLASARHLEATPLDVPALAREGNLPVLSWLSPGAREMVAELVESGRSQRLEGLLLDWRAPASDA